MLITYATVLYSCLELIELVFGALPTTCILRTNNGDIVAPGNRARLTRQLPMLVLHL